MAPRKSTRTTRLKRTKRHTRKTPKARGNKAIKTCDITHSLGYILDDDAQYYNEGMKRAGKTPKSLEYINDLSKQAFFSDLKSNYERDTLLKCFCWPKSIEEDPENLGELNKNNIVEHVISLCKNQPHDELIISYNMFDVDDWSYTRKYAYPCRCSDISQVRRTINYVLKKLQKFPFKSFNEFIDYKEKYNPFREEYGVTYVKIEFMSDVDDY